MGHVAPPIHSLSLTNSRDNTLEASAVGRNAPSAYWASPLSAGKLLFLGQNGWIRTVLLGDMHSEKEFR
jgi:hypothetical protein